MKQAYTLFNPKDILIRRGIFMKYRSKNIDNLGIIAGVCKEIGLVEEIDKIVGVKDKQMLWVL
ncbi:MAG TPA: DUF4277 domain-containing protein [Methanosarcinales archaeon]|nr:DUF4277 domain-containing protein [Methanosarcinales archaeon]